MTETKEVVMQLLVTVLVVRLLMIFISNANEKNKEIVKKENSNDVLHPAAHQLR